VEYWEKIVAPYVAKAPMYLENLVVALVILFVGRLIAIGLKNLAIKVMRRSHVDETLIGFGSSLGYFGFLALVIVAAINKLGVETTSFVAILGAAGLAIGLALQGSLSNFAAGALMIMFKPIKVGNFIEGAGVAGEVLEISIFTTVLKTADGKKVIIPNSKISGDNIINYSALGTRRVELNIGIPYDSDIKVAKDLILAVLKADSRVRPWVQSTDFGPVTLDMNERIKIELEKNGISIPFPQREVRVVYESPK